MYSVMISCGSVDIFRLYDIGRTLGSKTTAAANGSMVSVSDSIGVGCRWMQLRLLGFVPVVQQTQGMFGLV